MRNSLFNKEIQKKDFVGNDTHALFTKNKGRSKSRGLLGQNISKGKSKPREKTKCYHCGKRDQMKRNCKFLKQGINKSQELTEEDKNTIATTSISGNEVTLVCDQEDCYLVANQDVKWV